MIALKVLKYKILEYCLEILSNKLARNFHVITIPTHELAGREYKEISIFLRDGSEVRFVFAEIIKYSETSGEAIVTCKTRITIPPDPNHPMGSYDSDYRDFYNVNLLNASCYEYF